MVWALLAAAARARVPVTFSALPTLPPLGRAAAARHLAPRLCAPPLRAAANGTAAEASLLCDVARAASSAVRAGVDGLAETPLQSLPLEPPAETPLQAPFVLPGVRKVSENVKKLVAYEQVPLFRLTRTDSSHMSHFPFFPCISGIFSPGALLSLFSFFLSNPTSPICRTPLFSHISDFDSLRSTGARAAL